MVFTKVKLDWVDRVAGCLGRVSVDVGQPGCVFGGTDDLTSDIAKEKKTVYNHLICHEYHSEKSSLPLYQSNV